VKAGGYSNITVRKEAVWIENSKVNFSSRYN
jgi:hypothetical protein